VKFVLDGGTLVTTYTIIVCSYVVSRFALAAVYRAPRDVGLVPTVAIVVPTFNEGPAIARTIHACRAVDYPAEKLALIMVNDGSSDDTWLHMTEAAAQFPKGSVKCLDLPANRGKRVAMAAGIRAASADIVVFVDSDSTPGPGAVRKIVQGFADPRVGAVCGLTNTRNVDENLLTRLQQGRYYISFQLLKSAESVLGAVACCSGCFSAYRKSALIEVLEDWENQRFLGVPCTYGDDRALTNRVLKRGWITRYDCQAEAFTDVPDWYGKFFRQQLRWKKSWAREGPILLGHIWRSRPIAFPSVLLQTLTGLLSPFILIYNILYPVFTGVFPLLYVVGLYLIAGAYAIMYWTHRNDRLWPYAFLATLLYIVLSPQLIWAYLRIRDGNWGTRSCATPRASRSGPSARVRRPSRVADTAMAARQPLPASGADIEVDNV
jgi:hyaluronan synthase